MGVRVDWERERGGETRRREEGVKGNGELKKKGGEG